MVKVRKTYKDETGLGDKEEEEEEEEEEEFDAPPRLRARDLTVPPSLPPSLSPSSPPLRLASPYKRKRADLSTRAWPMRSIPSPRKKVSLPSTVACFPASCECHRAWP